MLILAASTQRTLGLVIAIIVAGGVALYLLMNIFSGRKEIGAELELAPNRKPYFDDAELESKRLDLSLAAGVGTLAIIALALPLYWLGEPGRTEGRADFTTGQFERRGEGSYEELCSSCHAAAGVGGSAAYTVLDDNGRFISSVNWTAPALNTVLYRFSVEEVTHILNYGRPQSPMPAWGEPGGGPLTTQQLEEIVEYLKIIQLTPEQMTEEIRAGLRDELVTEVRDANPDAADTLADEAASDAAKTAAQAVLTTAYNELVPGLGDAIDAVAALAGDADASLEAIEEATTEVDELLNGHIDELAATDTVRYGELLFNNPAGAGAYSCARCHTAGSSWDADGALAANPALEGLVDHEVPGGGGFGPGLLSVENQFTSAEAQTAFVSLGCTENQQYGNNGVCEPSGQMPGFGVDATELEGAMLTTDQIAAIVEYERGLE